MPSIGKTIQREAKVKRTERRKDGQWVYLLTPDGLIEMGPYESTAELKEDSQGVINYYLHRQEPKYVTIDKVTIKSKPIPYVPPEPVNMLEDLGESIMEE